MELLKSLTSYRIIAGEINEFTEQDFIVILSELMVYSSICTIIGMLIFGLKASYGRYSSQSKMIKIALPARAAWFLQEMPSFIIPIIAIWQAGFSSIPFVNALVLTMFTVHYAQRSFLYPFLIKGGKPTPIHLFILGVIFCTWNGYIQGFFHAKYATYEFNHLFRFTSILGLSLFIIGMVVNIHSDEILRGLRKQNESGYKIPFGGLFEFVSGANFFGEIVEWIGYALFAWTLTALAFAMFTLANLIPRAIDHHKWYIEKFENYPKKRKAIIPFLI